MVNVQWYPGHMEKARREMLDRLKAVDMIIELRDARIPQASRNPILRDMAQNKPRLIILAKTDLADPADTERWAEHFSREDNTACLALNLSRDSGIKKKVVKAALELMKPRRDRQIARGIRPRAVRAMACGIPNVGKSTLINRIAGKNTVKTADKPGVTRSLTWIHADPELDLLDTPGVLWPKFDDDRTGSVLAACGAINDNILPKKGIAMDTIRLIQESYPGLLETEYESGEVNPNGMLKAIAAKRHLLAEEGEPDTKRAADLFLHEFRKGKLGRITLEKVKDEEDEEMLSE